MEEQQNQTPERDALDDKINQVFAGKVVRKDLVRKVKVGANAPVFVLEFLLGKYCASSDELAIEMGLKVVNQTLAENYIGPDESTKAQSTVKEETSHKFIDKVKVRLTDSDYWAEVVNFGDRYVHLPTHYVREYDRLLMGGVWSEVTLRFEYDEESRGKHPFWIEKLAPIQIATFDADEYSSLRKKFSSDEWVDLLIRSLGYESTAMDRRLKLHFLIRLSMLKTPKTRLLPCKTILQMLPKRYPKAMRFKKMGCRRTYKALTGKLLSAQNLPNRIKKGFYRHEACKTLCS